MPKPSFGCIACRRRRVKCDERQPACGNCERYGNSCPGYPDKFDVLHRMRTTRPVPSQSATSLDHLQGSTRNDNEVPPQVGQALDQASVASKPVHPTSTPPPLLSYDHDSAALAMYYNSHCVDGSTVWSLDHLRSQGNGCLFAAIKVLGDMEIFKKWSLPDGSKAMLRNYTAAIKLLNASLTSPTESRSDSTLLATMILSAVEIKTAPSLASGYWEAHTKGAAALLWLRGMDQVTSRLGSVLYFQVSSQMIISCVLGRRDLPQELQALRNAVQTHLVDATHPVWKYQGALFRFTAFVAATRTEASELGLLEASRIVANAFEIYTDVSTIFKDAGREWHYDTRPSTKFSGLIGYEHVYQTILATQLWNGYRMVMIVLCTVVARVLYRFPEFISPDPELQAFSKNVVGILNREALEAVGAVSAAFALVGLKSAHHTPPLSADAQKSSVERRVEDAPVFRRNKPDSQALPYMHGCLMQWPIYFAAESEFVEPRTRRCLVEILDTAAQAMQIEQWRVLADKLRLVTL